MKRITAIILFTIIGGLFIRCKNTALENSKLIFHINENVQNAEEDYFIAIQNNWEEYLSSNNFVRSNDEYWNHDLYPYPDYTYISLLLGIRASLKNNKKLQCTTIGIVPVQNNFHLLKTVFTEALNNSQDELKIKFISSIYAKKEGGEFKFYSSTEYHKLLFENKKVGNINYIIHPDHNFSTSDAEKMNVFNEQLSKVFELEPLSFDYYVAKDTRDLSEITGMNLFSYSYQPVASGGMADNYNNTIYAGNNSSYYPHEVVHLYVDAKYPRQYHRWFNEGIAALLGGSTGYNIEWHWEKLRRYLDQNPNFEISDLTKLETSIPNGEFMTDFRYAIGALICQRIIDKHGMQGIFEALQSGRTDEDYFDHLKQSLNIDRVDFGNYIKSECKKLAVITDADLESYKY